MKYSYCQALVQTTRILPDISSANGIQNFAPVPDIHVSVTDGSEVLNAFLSSVNLWKNPCSMADFPCIKQITSVTITNQDNDVPDPHLHTNAVSLMQYTFGTDHTILGTTQIVLTFHFSISRLIKQHSRTHLSGFGA